MQVSVIVAVGQNGAIGKDGRVPWHLRSDLQRFKRTTMGHHLIVGRRTWEGIGRALPGRQMVVITRDEAYSVPEGVQIAHSLDEALAISYAAGDDEAFVAGGAQIYALAMPLATRLYLTEVQASPEADAWFPEWDRVAWVERSCDDYPAGEHDDHAFCWCVLERASALG